jgi:hypothetical protein
MDTDGNLSEQNCSIIRPEKKKKTNKQITSIHHKSELSVDKSKYRISYPWIDHHNRGKRKSILAYTSLQHIESF